MDGACQNQVRDNSTLWSGLLVCMLETLVPEDASKGKDEVEADLDEVWNMTKHS